MLAKALRGGGWQKPAGKSLQPRLSSDLSYRNLKLWPGLGWGLSFMVQNGKASFRWKAASFGTKVLLKANYIGKVGSRKMEKRMDC